MVDVSAVPRTPEGVLERRYCGEGQRVEGQRVNAHHGHRVKDLLGPSSQAHHGPPDESAEFGVSNSKHCYY